MKLNTFNMDRLINLVNGDNQEEFLMFAKDVLDGRGLVRRVFIAGPEWWQDGWASKKIDRTLRHPMQDMREGKLQVRDGNGKVRTITDLQEQKGRHDGRARRRGGNLQPD